ncbi:MAG: DUF5606 domain-containing protein [Chitinophagales bacterium]|nr:DUF5606 domain-containing protein [Chitinophagales bacterium]
MEFKDILSISGLPGLHSLISTKGNGIVVKSLEDGKTQFVSSRIHGISSLDNISVYRSQDETISLRNVLAEMHKQESTLPLPDPKSDPETLKNYFRQIIPDYDEERVHFSDMKKMIKWHQLLRQHDSIPSAEEPEIADTAEDKSGKEAEA